MKTPKMMMSLMMLLLAINGIYAQNSMPIMQTFKGHYGNSWFGERITAMDYNADGYDDLILYSRKYGTNQLNAILFYFGSTQMDSIPDIVLQSQYPGQVNANGFFLNAGDVNGDGLDDFVTGFGATINGEFNNYRYLYLGSDTFNVNDRILMYQVPNSNSGGQIFAGAYGIGDINGDGYDDMVYCNGDSWYNNNKIRLGGNNIMMTEEITVESFSAANLLNLGSWQKVAYGDFNGDGYSDLAGSDWLAFTWIGHAGIWLGKAIPNGMYDLRISSPSTSPFHQFGWQLAAGDFNGDGFCDLAVSAPQSDSPNPWYNGYVYIFAGNAQLTDISYSHIYRPSFVKRLKLDL